MEDTEELEVRNELRTQSIASSTCTRFLTFSFRLFAIFVQGTVVVVEVVVAEDQEDKVITVTVHMVLDKTVEMEAGP